MTTHILTYLKRRVASGSSAFSSVDDSVVEALTIPAGHGFGQDWLWERHQRGEDIVIWLISILRFGRSYMPPSLDARIQVSKVYSRENISAPPYIQRLLRTYKYAFAADRRHSYYLPWRDASKLLLNLEFELSNSPSWHSNLLNKKWSVLPLHLQTPRILTEYSSSNLQRFAEATRLSPIAFISYRWREGTELAKETAMLLSELGVGVWWDRWSMPRSVVEGKTSINPKGIRKAIDMGCRNCKYGVAIKTKSYASEKSPWTKAEYEILKHKNLHRELRLLEIDAEEDNAKRHIKSQLVSLM
jgi:hypothetical protein